MASRLKRSVPVTVNDVLDGHAALDLECLDRLYLLTELQDVAAGQSADRRRASRPFGARPRDHDG